MMTFTHSAQPECTATQGSEHHANAATALSDDEFTDQMRDVIPHLRAFGRSLCRADSLADDLVQDTLLKAWQARHRFQAGTNFKAWMFVILRNGFLSTVRRRKFEQGTESTDPSLRSAHAAQEGHMALLEVREAIKHLPPDQREVLLLVGAAGMTYEEAADICRCQVGTIKSRLSRARTALHRLLDEGRGVRPVIKADEGRRHMSVAV